MIPQFHLGQVIILPGALRALERSGEQAAAFLRRHARANWGDLTTDHRKQNNQNLREGGPLISRYRTTKGEYLVVITSFDHSFTTLLSQDEY